MSNICKNKLLLVILRLMSILITIAVLLIQEMNTWTTTSITIRSTNRYRIIKGSNAILLRLNPGQKTNPYFHCCVKTRKNASSNNNNYNNNSTSTKREEDPRILINSSVKLKATESTFNVKLRRRDALFLHRNMFLLYIVSLQQQSTALSISTATITSNNKLPKFYYYYYFDIPSKPPNFIRLYLIRHGQTENNRLNIVQGAHVDTSLNDLGKLQAKQLGQALSRLQQQQHRHHRNLLFVHSMYQRSKETATIAASTYSHHHLMNTSSVQLLPSIRTIDFGLQEKKRYEMNQIYSSWSLGLIDVKLTDGESCRQVSLAGFCLYN
jgi:hypothetical protein